MTKRFISIVAMIALAIGAWADEAKVSSQKVWTFGDYVPQTNAVYAYNDIYLHGGAVFGMFNLRNRSIERKVGLCLIGTQSEVDAVDIQPHLINDALCRTAVLQSDVRFQRRNLFPQCIQHHGTSKENEK